MDRLTPHQRSRLMARIRGKDTQPEWIVRRLVFRLGFRYRLHMKSLPGSPDLVFRSKRKIIFVHGCFWHWHRAQCPKFCMPKSRVSYWRVRLHRNAERDKAALRKLRRNGWRVLVVWECQTKDTNRLARKLAAFLGDGG